MTNGACALAKIQGKPTESADELADLNGVMTLLNRHSQEARDRMLVAVTSYFGYGRPPGAPAPGNPVPLLAGATTTPATPFPPAAGGSTTPKDFVAQKQPQQDTERVAILAYYLANSRSVPHFKTADISKLNTEAAQKPFSNAAQAVKNAETSGLIVPAGKRGFKQLSAGGEAFVQALPDREAARLAKERHGKKRGGRKRSGSKKK